MDEEILYIKLDQIPGGVRLSENYSRRLVECIQQDNMNDSMHILQELIIVIGEINRSYILKVLYQMFGYSVKTLKQYLYSILENCKSDHLFARGHGQFYEECKVEGSLTVQTGFSFSVTLDPGNSTNLEISIKDGIFKDVKADKFSARTDPAAITAAAFADTLYNELYFPAIKLLTGDDTGKAAKSFISSIVDDLFVPYV